MYGKHVPNTRVETSELADRVRAITFLENNNDSNMPNFDRRPAFATLCDPI
jgi:hypothetical protein